MARKLLTKKRTNESLSPTTRRRARTLGQEQAGLRSLIDGEALLRRIAQYTMVLYRGYETLRPDALDPNRPDNLEQMLSPHRVGQIKAALDSSFKLLNKKLPDQRSLEITENPINELSQLERANRIAAILGSVATEGAGSIGGAVEGPAGDVVDAPAGASDANPWLDS